MTLQIKKISLGYWASLAAALVGLSALLIESSVIWAGDWPVELAALIAGGVLIAGYAAWRAFKGNLGLPRCGIQWAALSLAGGLVLSLVFSPDARQGMERAAWLLFYLAMLYLLADALDVGVDRAALRHAVLWFSGFILLAAVFETYGWYLNWWGMVGSRSVMPPFAYRVVSLISHSNGLMGFANLCAPLAVVGFLSSKSRSERVWSGLWIVLYAITVPFSSSRGGWLGMASWMFVLLGLWAWETKAYRQALHWLKAHAVLSLAAGALALVLLGVVGVKFYSTFAASNPTHAAGFSLNREVIWQGAFNIWKSSPLFGAGPGRFGLEYLRVDGQFPPGFWAGYAHSMPLQFLAELGLVGFLPFLALILGGAVGTVRMYMRTPMADRLWSRAALAALAGFAVHSVFDDFSISPLIMTLAIFLAVWIWTTASPNLPRFRRVSLAAFALPALAMLAFGAWNLWAYSPLYRGISAAQDHDWAKAANLAEESLRRDPNLAYYAEQAGLAWGRVWGQTGDAAALDKAQQRLTQSLASEPDYSLLWADLAVLEWQAGKPDVAIAHMQAAVRLGPYMPDYPLNLGWFQEQSGRNPEALQAYQAALKLQPEWAAGPFWQLSEVRKTASIRADFPAAGETYAQQARMEIAAGELQAARTSLALGQIGGEPEDALIMAGALLAEAQNQPDLVASEDKALVAYLLEAYWNFPGPAEVYNLYHRRHGFPSAVAPGYIKILDTSGQAEVLGKVYAQQAGQGDCTQALQTWEVWQLVQTGGQALTNAQPAPACP